MGPRRDGLVHLRPGADTGDYRAAAAFRHRAHTPGNVGYYGSLLLALFMIGWGASMIWVHSLIALAASAP